LNGLQSLLEYFIMDSELANIMKKFSRGLETLDKLTSSGEKDKERYIRVLWENEIDEPELCKELENCKNLKIIIEKDSVREFNKIIHKCSWIVLALFFCKNVNFVASGKYNYNDSYLARKAINGIMRCIIRCGAREIAKSFYQNNSKQLSRKRLLLYLAKYNLYNWDYKKKGISELTMGLNIGMKWQDFVLNAIELGYDDVAIKFAGKIENEHQKILELATERGYIDIVDKILEKGDLILQLQKVYDIALKHKDNRIMLLLKQYSCFLFPNFWDLSDDRVQEINRDDKLEKLYDCIINDDITTFDNYRMNLEDDIDEKVDEYNKHMIYVRDDIGVEDEGDEKYLKDLFGVNVCRDLKPFIVKLQWKQVNYDSLLMVYQTIIINFLTAKMNLKSPKRKRYQIFLEDIYQPNLCRSARIDLLFLGLAYLNNSRHIIQYIKGIAFKNKDVMKYIYNANFY